MNHGSDLRGTGTPLGVFPVLRKEGPPAATHISLDIAPRIAILGPGWTPHSGAPKGGDRSGGEGVLRQVPEDGGHRRRQARDDEERSTRTEGQVPSVRYRSLQNSANQVVRPPRGVGLWAADKQGHKQGGSHGPPFCVVGCPALSRCRLAHFTKSVRLSCRCALKDSPLAKSDGGLSMEISPGLLILQ